MKLLSYDPKAILVKDRRDGSVDPGLDAYLRYLHAAALYREQNGEAPATAWDDSMLEEHLKKMRIEYEMKRRQELGGRQFMNTILSPRPAGSPMKYGK